MSKKIEGFIAEISRKDGSVMRAFEQNRIGSEWVPATLVINPGGKVYTQAEVEDILRKAAHTINDRGSVDVRTIINIAEESGITL